MFEILLLLAGLAVGIVLIGGGFQFGKMVTNKEPEAIEAPVSNFTCPYCTIEVTGAKQLDLINHIPCITKAEADIILMQKNAKKEIPAVKDEYLATYTTLRGDWKHISAHPGYQSFRYESGSGKYVAVEWSLYRNGEKIDYGWLGTRDAAEKSAKASQTLDEHKRRTAHKRAKVK